MAVELLKFSADAPSPSHDEMSDIWAFGMVVYVCATDDLATINFMFIFCSRSYSVGTSRTTT